MSFAIGLVGLPNVGKSTLFKAITNKQVEVANYPFCTIDPNVGTVAVPDATLGKLALTAKSKKITPTIIEFIDIAGLVKGAHQGEGLGNKFLSHIREVSAICQVVRLFNDPNVTHVHNKIDPLEDINIINLELIMADIATVEKRLSGLEKKLRGSGAKDEKKLFALLKQSLEHLLAEKLLNTLSLSTEEKNLLKACNLLTIKPIFYALNTDENITHQGFENFPSPAMTISAKIEAELTELGPTAKLEFLQELGWQESGLDRLITLSYELLGLLTFYTAGPEEARAWTIIKGDNAKTAAAQIHTDISEGFIKAEIVTVKDFLLSGGWTGAKDKGLVRLEGKEYIMQPDDIAYFHFNK